MANELKHGSVGTELTQAEWEAVGAHVVANQAVGDIIYASTTAQLRRLGAGSTNDVLRITGGLPDWQATTFITSLGTIATGVWQATDVGVAYGGTGVSTLTANGVLVGNGASAIGSIDMSTKGHVLIGDGSGNPQMLGVGTNNHVMTADSGETTGVKWAAPAAAAAGSLTGSTLASGVVTTSATTVGILNGGSITSGFGNIDVGASSIAAGSFDASDGNITNVGDIALDSLSADSTNIIVNGAIDVQAGYANGGGAPYDGVVDVGNGGNWATLQAGDDALDGGSYTMLVKSGTYAAGMTVSTDNALIVVEPGTVIEAAITISGDDVTLRLGAGCSVEGAITLSGANCSLICANGVDIEQVLISGASCTFDGGGFDTLVDSTGSDNLEAVTVLSGGTDAMLSRFAATSGTGGTANKAMSVGDARVNMRDVRILDSDADAIYMDGTDGRYYNVRIYGADGEAFNCQGARNTFVQCGVKDVAGRGFRILGDDCQVVGCMVQDQGSDSIRVDNDNCVVVANRLDGAVADEGTGNTIASNDETAF